MGRDQWPTDDQIETSNTQRLLGRVLERSDLVLEWLRHINQRLEDGERDFRALAVADATLVQQTLRNTEDIAEITDQIGEIRKELAMRAPDDQPTVVLGQLTEFLRTAKEFVEAVAPVWKLTVGAFMAFLFAKGIVNPQPYIDVLKLILKGEPG